MRPHRRLSRPIAVAAILAAACSGEAGGAAGIDLATAQVEYRFNDSSVPPEYHRSYTVTVADGEARMVVDSYGDELHDVTAPVDDETWADAIERLEALDVRTRRAEDGCTGGTSRELRVTDADHATDEPALEVYTEVCNGGEDEADAVDAAVAPVLALFDTETLLATG